MIDFVREVGLDLFSLAIAAIVGAIAAKVFV